MPRFKEVSSVRPYQHTSSTYSAEPEMTSSRVGAHDAAGMSS